MNDVRTPFGRFVIPMHPPSSRFALLIANRDLLLMWWLEQPVNQNRVCGTFQTFISSLMPIMRVAYRLQHMKNSGRSIKTLEQALRCYLSLQCSDLRSAGSALVFLRDIRNHTHPFEGSRSPIPNCLVMGFQSWKTAFQKTRR
jgi:hypothetical protein